MSRRDKLKGIFDNTVEELATANFADEMNTERGPASPVRSMALTLGKMEEEAKAMHDALVAGLHVQDIDPALIDDSFVRDRIGTAVMSKDDAFVLSIAQNGQEVPILVRPHPSRGGRYQVAYGHRRLRAARILDIPVKAIVKSINDDELIVAQGLENTARANLTYIEKATFAQALEEKGFKRALIMKALTTDKTELSKMISVASAIPISVIEEIGNTPAYGRRKWITFSEVYDERKRHKLDALFQTETFRNAESDSRFDMALGQLVGRSAKATSRPWNPGKGKLLAGSIRTDAKTYTLSLRAEEARDFGEFLTGKLDELYADFKRQTGD